LDSITLDGQLTRPANAAGLVVFVHGSGSSRFSPRNIFVSEILQSGGMATLLFDLLTPEEGQIDDSTRQYRFNINLLAERTGAVLDWIARQPNLHGSDTGRITGLFGASTGAAAALYAAALKPEVVKAVVSRGGRPDLAEPVLPSVKAPTLLIAGERDPVVVDLNRQALSSMTATLEKKLVVVPGANHLFEEPGTLEKAARWALDWFTEHLR
jgi:pimeloyl-ACP methyl ester carboxylesterase